MIFTTFFVFLTLARSVTSLPCNGCQFRIWYTSQTNPCSNDRSRWRGHTRIPLS